MKKVLGLLLVLSLLLPGFTLGEGAEDDPEISLAEEAELTEETEEVLPDGPEASGDEDYILDTETGETYVLTTEEQQKYESLLAEEPEEESDIDLTALNQNGNLPGNVFNILLLGVDTRSNDPLEIEGLADTQIIVSVNRDTGAIKMTSILRDSYVVVGSYGSRRPVMDRINTSFLRGCNQAKGGTQQEKTHSGAARAMRTVNFNFQMNIENYVAINFNGLASIIDAMGGIDVDLTKAEASYINSYLRKHPPKYDNRDTKERVKLEEVSGVQHLDGVQAVMYARIRSLKGQNDFNRTDRQRHLLELLLQKLLTMDLVDMMELVSVAASYSDTNMNFQSLLDLALALLPSLSQIEPGAPLFEEMRIPIEKSFSYKTVNGSSVVSYKTAKQAEALHEFVYGTYYPAD